MASRTSMVLPNYGVKMPEHLYKRIYDLRSQRNAVAHGKAEVTREDVVDAIKLIDELEAFLGDISQVESTDTDSKELANKAVNPSGG